MKLPNNLTEGWPSGQWQQTVNLPTEVYVSSNLTPSTIFVVNNCVFEFVVHVMLVLKASATEALRTFTFAFNNNLI